MVFLLLQVLAGAGAINHDELVKYAEKEFSGLSNDPTTAAQLVEKSPAIFTGSEVLALSASVVPAWFGQVQKVHSRV